jgi:hypothetical protein
VAAFAGAKRCHVAQTEPWIEITREQFWLDPAGQLRRLYRRYQAAVQDTGVGVAQLEQEE